MTDGKDPDEFIKKNGRDAFLQLVDGAVPYIDYKLRYIRKGMDLETEEGKIDFIKAAAGVLRELSPVEADVYIKKLAGELRIAEGAIKMEIIGNTTNVPGPLPQRRSASVRLNWHARRRKRRRLPERTPVASRRQRSVKLASRRRLRSSDLLCIQLAFGRAKRESQQLQRGRRGLQPLSKEHYGYVAYKRASP